MTSNQYHREFGKLLKKYRIKDNLTHERLSELVQTDGNTISRYERGVQTPHSDMFVRLIDTLKIPNKKNTGRNRIDRCEVSLPLFCYAPRAP